MTTTRALSCGRGAFFLCFVLCQPVLHANTYVCTHALRSMWFEGVCTHMPTRTCMQHMYDWSILTTVPTMACLAAHKFSLPPPSVSPFYCPLSLSLSLSVSLSLSLSPSLPPSLSPSALALALLAAELVELFLIEKVIHDLQAMSLQKGHQFCSSSAPCHTQTNSPSACYASSLKSMF